MRLALAIFTLALPCFPAKFSKQLGSVSVRFEPNRGQTDSDVLYFARDDRFRVALRKTEAEFVLTGRNGRSEAVRMRLAGALAPESVTGEELLSGRSNYLIGADPSRWIQNVAHYSKVRYRRVYPGVDLVYYSRDAKLEYDFVLAPGADPRLIRLGFEGAKLSLDANGDLILKMPGGVVRQHKPVAYQVIDGARRPVEARYVLAGRHVSFALGQYDQSKELVVDPVLVYSSFLGGSAGDRGAGIAVDAQGNAYVTGTTASPNFSKTGAYQTTKQGTTDVFVTKINAAGTEIVYSTYIGGTQTTMGFGNDHGRAITVDSQGVVTVAGVTDSSNFPVTTGVVQGTFGGGFGDGFVSRLNAAGNALLFSTYVGGSDTDEIHGLAIDKAGSIFVAGMTKSTNLPLSGAIQNALKGDRDGFVTKLNSTATSRTFATYLGGTGEDAAYDIALDASGNAYITGETQSSDFPVSAAYRSAKSSGGDAFLVKLLGAGTLAFSTFLGGNGRDQGFGVAVDANGGIYVAGETASSDFPVTGGGLQRTMGGFSDAFVTKFNSTGLTLSYSTYLGGSLTDGAFAIAVDGAGQVHITGRTWSSNFPLKDPFQQVYGGAFSDGFVARLNATGTALLYSSYLGGKNEDNADNSAGFLGIGGVALDTSGNAYYTGRTDSEDFPITTGSFQTTFGGRTFTIGDDSAFDSFVTKISPLGGSTGSGGSGGSGMAITGVNPTTVLAGSGSVMVTVTGTGFTSQSVVRINGQNRPTVLVAADQLRVTLTAADTSTAAGLVLSVYDGSTGNASGTVMFFVTATQTQVPDAPTAPSPSDGTQGVALNATLSWTGSSLATSYDVYLGTSTSPSLVATVSGTSYTATLRAQTTYYWRVAARNATANISSNTWTFGTGASGVSSSGYRYVPMTPCRVADTRSGQGITGAFGPPSLTGGSPREFVIPSGRCNVPATARAYSLNVTVAPKEPLGYLSMWPTGQSQPTVSTLNSPHGGIVANAAIVPAGLSGSITVLATNATDLIVDINGYFEPAGTYSFYSVNPCRVADTRAGTGFAGTLGTPYVAANATRELSVLSGACNLPGTAAAYSLNVTAVPMEPLSYLTLWPGGAARPLVSTLNAMDGTVVANAAIVPAGLNGTLQAFATNNTDLVLDVNGYFGQSGYANEMLFQPVTPCRVADTRVSGSGAPVLSGGQKRDFTIGGRCGVPNSARAYSLNVTVVPTAALGYLTIWPGGQSQPTVSTLNSYLGRIVANAALVPAGLAGTVSVFATNETHVIIDVNGYFQ